MTTIPMIDLTGLSPGDDALSRQLVRAYGETGFAYIRGHGIPESLIEQFFEASRRFHALPTAAKMAVALDANHRGFIAIDTSTDRTSTLAEVTRPNQSESFMVMREAGPEDPEVLAGAFLAGPNQWPDLPGFRATVTAYQDALTAFSARMIHAFAASIGLPTQALDPLFDPPTTWLRLLHYPPQPASQPEDLYGSAPHTDWGAITVLAQDDVGGLQVRNPDGAWLDAPPEPGTFVLNVGDMLHRLSNGRLRSTPHRVINSSGRERYSCPFFYDPGVRARITPMSGAPRFEPIVYGDFLRREMSASYDRHADPAG